MEEENVTDPDSRLSLEHLLERLRKVQYIMNDVQYQLHDIEAAVAAEVKRQREEQKLHPDPSIQATGRTAMDSRDQARWLPPDRP
jgi:hypothetical protein